MRPTGRREVRTPAEGSRARPACFLPPPSRACAVPASPLRWFWDGLLQDRPLAIVTLLALVTLALGAVAAGAYLLVQVL
jgi:hypothetical protein